MELFWTAAFTLAAGLAFAFAYGEIRQNLPAARMGATLLVLLGLVLTVFALQEAFGLMSQLVTGNLRLTAREEGWYRERRSLQGAAVGVIVPVGFVCLAAMTWLTRRAGRRYLPLAAALTFLAGFGALQAVSLHQWDARLRHRFAGVQLGTWGNAAGLAAAFLSFVPIVRGAAGTATSRRPRF